VFRDGDVPDLTVLNYFDENEVPVKNYDVEKGDVHDFMVSVIGKPRNYGPSREELEHARQEIIDQKVSSDCIIAYC
jgi:malate/lactate dehydrogenase